METLEKSNPEELLKEVEAYGKFKGWDGYKIHQEFIAKLDERKAKEEQEKRVVRLPAESNTNRAAPNAIIRSAVFGIVERGKRPDLKRAVIAAQNGYEITYTGERLDQTDFDVWLAIKHLCVPYPLGTEVTITTPEILKVLKRKDGRSTRKWLINSLRRMTECTIGMRTETQGFLGHMIEYCKWDDKTYTFAVTLSKNMAPFFEDKSYTLLKTEARNQLKKELTRWLHAYWSSHNEIYPIKDTTLYKLCGSKGSIKQFREHLRKSLKELEQIGFIEEGSKVERDGMVKTKKRRGKKNNTKAGQKKLMDSDGVLLDSDGVLLDSDGVLLDSDGVLLDSDGVLLDSDGVLLDSDGVSRKKKSPETLPVKGSGDLGFSLKSFLKSFFK